MNQNRRPMDKKTRKEMEKEVKEGQKALDTSEEPARSDELTPSDILDRHPKVKKSLLDSTVKSMEVKKKKTPKKSKRTTPGDIDHRESSPKHVHAENERWKENLNQRRKADSKAIEAKLQKRKGKNGK